MALVQAVRAGAPGRVPVALRAALCVGLPLALGLVMGHPTAGAAAAFGGLATVYLPDAPYRYRARAVAVIGAGLVLAVLLGGLASANPVLAVVVSGVGAAVALFLCHALELPPPRELMPVMALLVAAEVPVSPAEAIVRAGFAAAGAAFAWIVTMTPALRGRREPERRAVVAAFDAVAGLLDGIGSEQAAPARHAAVSAVTRARRAVVLAGRESQDPLGRSVVVVEALLEAALHVGLEADGVLDPGWAAAVRTLAPGRGGPSGPLPDAGAVVGADLLIKAMAGVSPPVYPVLPDRRTARELLRSAAAGDAVVLPAALRLGFAVAAGVALGRMLGVGHAYWVGLTVVAVLQGSNLAVTRTRMTHRIAGTVAGLALAYAVLGWGPPLWFVVLAAAVFQFLVELVIATHYGLAVAAITPLAMLLFHLGSPTADLPVALGERMLDTALGVVVALALRLVLWPRSTSARLPRLQARIVAAVGRTLAVAWTETASPALAAERRSLQRDLAALRAMHADALADSVPLLRPHEPQWEVSAAAEDLAILALSWPPDWRRPDPLRAKAFLAHLGDLAAAVRGATVPRDAVPVLPGLPRTTAAARDLAAALEERDQRP